MVGKVVASSVCLLLANVLWFTSTYVVSSNPKCVPIKLCPMAIKLIKNNPDASNTKKFFRNFHCGYEGNQPKVWCDLSSKCTTPDSKNGTCKYFTDCTILNKFFPVNKNADPVVRKYLTESIYMCIAEADSQLKVCCPNEERLTKSIEPKIGHDTPSLGLRACGRTSSLDKIIGGTTTFLEEFPWMALLKYISRGRVIFGCGGSLINEYYVLTAAHCVDPEIIKIGKLGRLESVILGEYDTRNKTDCTYIKYRMDCADPPQEIAYSYYKLHPEYNPNSMINDIAIIRLKQKVKFSDYVQPICLPPINFKLNGKETFTISGWGVTETLKSSPVKRKAKLPYVDRSFCNQFMRWKLSEQQICAGRGEGVNRCHGDSGGPLMLDTTKNGLMTTFLLGITSYGYGYSSLCDKFPGVYTYIPPYVNWIQEEIR